MAKNCERCRGVDVYKDDKGREVVADFVDYCAECGKNLCKKCMAKGCCGKVPAASGVKADYGDDDDDE